MTELIKDPEAEARARALLESLDPNHMVQIGDNKGGYIVSAEFALIAFDTLVKGKLDDPGFIISAWPCIF